MANLTQAKQIKKNLLAPVAVSGFAVGFENLTASTIAFADTNPDTITDSGSGLAGFAAGQVIEIAGSTSNDGTYTIATVAAGTLTLVAGDSLTVEALGATVTITVVGELVTTELTTAALTAGNNGTAVDNVPSTAFDVAGWSVSAPQNYVYLSDDTNLDAIPDANDKDVFARITESAGVYTIRYLSLVAGVEVPYAFTAAETIIFTTFYNNEFDDLPYDMMTRIPNVRLLEDPAGGGVSSFAEGESNTVTGDDTFSALANTPLAGAKVTLIINSETYVEDLHFTRSGTALTWTFTKGSPNFGFTVKTTDDVSAYYRY